MAIHTLSLCSGVGMLDLGLRAGFEHLGIVARTVCYVEREAFAASQLVALMEAECLDEAPVWSDITTFDGRPWRGVVDCIVAGLPCQPYSVAGKQQGLTDARSFGDGDGPVAHALRIIAECQPALVWLENVPPWVRGGFFQPVGEELSRLGYSIAEPLFLAASDAGAAHKRERVFILAYSPDRGRRILRESSGRGGLADRGGEAVADAKGIQRRREQPATGARCGRCGLAGNGDVVADANGDQLRADSGQPDAGPDGRDNVGGIGADVADSNGIGLRRQSDQEQLPSGTDRRGPPLFAPGPLNPRWAGIIADYPHLAPAVKPRVRGLAHGFTWLVDESRRHQLRALGNGAVPSAFAAAVILLARELK